MTTPNAASGPGSGAEFRTWAAAAAATQAVLDAISAGQLRGGQLDDCGFWSAKAAAIRHGPEPVAAHAGTGPAGWPGRGFTRPGPGTEVPRDLYRAALEDALAYTADNDGCSECDRGQLCETHAARAARAEQYQRAWEQEMEASS
jgi:hypothetical protein